MSENISIKVDGTATTVGVDRLRTNIEDGSTREWMPESELKEAAGLRVWRNGEYAASSFGVDGFDVVEVAINGRGGDGAALTGEAHKLPSEGATPVIAEGGRGYAMGGAERVAVAKFGGGTLPLVPVVSGTFGELVATQNGTYRAAGSGLYAYDSADVDVEGGGGGGGLEPPDSIAVTRAPNVTRYSENETIDYTGIVVQAFQNGEIWTGNGVYPNGVIPFEELRFPIDKAHFNPYKEGCYTTPSGMIVVGGVSFQGPIKAKACMIAHSVTWYSEGTHGTLSGLESLHYYHALGSYMAGDGEFHAVAGRPYDELILRVATDGTDYLIACAESFRVQSVIVTYKTDGAPYYIAPSPGQIEPVAYPGVWKGQYTQASSPSSYTFDDRTVYYLRLSASGDATLMGWSDIDQDCDAQIAWYLIYGNNTVLDNREDIPVKWRRGVDGAWLETSFVIYER